MSATILASLYTDRPGPAFGISCFHSEIPTVRRAESSKDHSLSRNAWNPRGESSKEHTFSLRAALKLPILQHKASAVGRRWV